MSCWQKCRTFHQVQRSGYVTLRPPRRCDAGLHYLIPFIDKPRPIVWRHTEVYLERHTNKQQSTVTQTQEERI